MDWIASIVARADEAEARYKEKLARHNFEIDIELRELDCILSNDLIPGKPIAKAQEAIMRSQIRLLRRQWEALRME